MAVINPTAVQGKAATLTSLGADVLFMSETSAVSVVQTKVRQALKARGFYSVWGSPVQPHMSKKTGEGTMRGHAVGVALASTFPLHHPTVPVPPDVLASHRFVEGMLCVGNLQLRVIALYGFPSTYVEARSRNQQLLQMALDRVALSRIPTVVGGDMNMCPGLASAGPFCAFGLP